MKKFIGYSKRPNNDESDSNEFDIYWFPLRQTGKFCQKKASTIMYEYIYIRACRAIRTKRTLIANYTIIIIFFFYVIFHIPKFKCLWISKCSELFIGSTMLSRKIFLNTYRIRNVSIWAHTQ